MRVEYHPQAASDLNSAVDHYNGLRPGLGKSTPHSLDKPSYSSPLTFRSRSPRRTAYAPSAIALTLIREGYKLNQILKALRDSRPFTLAACTYSERLMEVVEAAATR